MVFSHCFWYNCSFLKSQQAKSQNNYVHWNALKREKKYGTDSSLMSGKLILPQIIYVWYNFWRFPFLKHYTWYSCISITLIWTGSRSMFTVFICYDNIEFAQLLSENNSPNIFAQLNRFNLPQARLVCFFIDEHTELWVL